MTLHLHNMMCIYACVCIYNIWHMLYTAFWTGLDWRFYVLSSEHRPKGVVPMATWKLSSISELKGFGEIHCKICKQVSNQDCVGDDHGYLKSFRWNAPSLASQKLAASIAQSSSSANRKPLGLTVRLPRDTREGIQLVDESSCFIRAFCHQDATKYSNFWLRTNLWHRGGTISAASSIFLVLQSEWCQHRAGFRGHSSANFKQLWLNLFKPLEWQVDCKGPFSHMMRKDTKGGWPAKSQCWWPSSSDTFGWFRIPLGPEFLNLSG